MKIIAADIYAHDLRYADGSYSMSGGRTVTTLPSTLVRLRTDEGIEGWGEACPLGDTYLESFAGGVRAALPQLAEALVRAQADPRETGVVGAAMDATLRGQAAAKSAIDVACWDILGKSAGLPVCTLLGGRRQADFPLYVALPLGTPDAMAVAARAQIALGIRALQLKLGADPRGDAARVRAVREAAGEDVLIVADANGGWRRHDAIAAARLLEGVERLILEQPCPTYGECRELRRHTTLPFSLDEIVVDLVTLAEAACDGAIDAINLKIGRVGGLTTARAMRDAAAALGVRMTIEDSWGGDLVTAAVSHLAASTPPEALLHASFMNDWVSDHAAGYAPRSRDGRGAAPDAPGLGIEVDAAALGAPLVRVGG